MELIKLIEDVNRQRLQLEILKADPAIDADSLAICDFLVVEMAYSLDDLSADWVPTDPANLKTLLARTVHNLNEARLSRNDGMLFVNPSRADHLFRLKLGMLAIDGLEFMLETLVLAMAAKQKTETLN